MPTTAEERMLALDVLRAVALFGVFLINMEFFTRPLQASGYGVEPGLAGLDLALARLVYVVGTGKFWMLFAMLFGMGFAVMSGRAEHQARAFAAPYLRRLGALLVFGIAHGVLLWSGDILHLYAVAGLALMAILRGRPWWLLLPVPGFVAAGQLTGGIHHFGGALGCVWFACAAWWIRRGGVSRLWQAGAALYAALSCVFLGMRVPQLFAAPDPERQAAAAERFAKLQAEFAAAADVHASGSYLDNVAYRLRYFADSVPEETALLVYAVGMFLIGVWFVRAGVIADPRAHRAMLARVARMAIPAGLALALSSALLATGYEAGQGARYSVAAHVMMLANLALSVGYACTVLWLLQRGARLAWLAPAGRMALTNYLLQSLIGTLLFYGYGAGLWGRVDRVGQLLLVIAVFALQLAASHWWLRRFQFGPMEWLWRAITYGRRPGFRRAPAAPAHPAASQV